MGKNEHCTYCIKFRRRTISPTWGSSNRVVEVPGCEKCESRHEAQVDALKARITALELENEDKRNPSEETELSKLLAKSARDMLDQKTKYEQFLSGLKLKLSLELNEVKGDNDILRKKAAKESSWQKVVKSETVEKVVKIETVEKRKEVGDVYDSCHEADVSALKARITSLECEIEDNKKSCEKTELSKLLAKSSSDMLAQQTEYEQLLAEVKLELSLELNEVKGYNDSLRKKVQFLQVCRNSISGDVVLAVSGLQVSAHRAILAAKSPSWQKVVKSEAVEKPKEVINIYGISPSVLEAVVDFCYTGEVTFSALVRADEVLKVAHALELGLLKGYCEAELCRLLTVENVPEMLKLSRKYEGTKLEEEAGKIFKEHFDKLKSKVYEVLEGLDTSTASAAESNRGACSEIFHEIGFDTYLQ